VVMGCPFGSMGGGFSYLKQFAEREGHCQVLATYKTDDGYRLGVWVTTRRESKSKIDPDRRQRLEGRPGWSWAVHSDRWEKGFTYLNQIVAREGHCRMPKRYKTEDGFALGRWILSQRATKDKMDADRRQRLEALPGWVWKSVPGRPKGPS
jgi:Helicase associated domain